MKEWVPKELVLSAGDKSVQVRARVLVEEEYDPDKPRIFFPILIGIICLSAIVLPLIIMLNFPLMILRSVVIYFKEQYHKRKPRIILDSFTCTSCLVFKKPYKLPGYVPQDFACRSCGFMHHLQEAV